MSELWPHLPDAVAAKIFADLQMDRPPQPADCHDAQTWAPVGGRVPSKRIRTLIESVTELARTLGFPEGAGPEARVAFDRAAAPLVRAHMDLAWAEAGNRSLWSFLSLVVLPHVTMWRFGVGNPERWIASDLTRHTWARLWWQAVVFDGRDDVLAALSESDLNQLLERRSIGGDPRLVAAIAKAVINTPADLARREVIRDVAGRLRRYLAFVDVRALNDAQVEALCQELCAETFHGIRLRASATP